MYLHMYPSMMAELLTGEKARAWGQGQVKRCRCSTSSLYASYTSSHKKLANFPTFICLCRWLGGAEGGEGAHKNLIACAFSLMHARAAEPRTSQLEQLCRTSEYAVYHQFKPCPTCLTFSRSSIEILTSSAISAFFLFCLPMGARGCTEARHRDKRAHTRQHVYTYTHVRVTALKKVYLQLSLAWIT